MAVQSSMNHRAVFFRGNLNAPKHLEESENLFVLRVQNGLDPLRVLSSIKGVSPHLDKFHMLADFPSSDAYVFRCNENEKGLRDEIKKWVKASGSPEVDYIGSVFNYANTNIFQIYTENIFLKFHGAVSTPEIENFLAERHLIVKSPVHFGDKVFFIEAEQSHGRDIFEFCEELLHYGEVEYCHPELVTRLRPVIRTQSAGNRVLSQLDKDWWLQRTGAFKAWKKSQGEGTTIAVIDDGLEMRHPAFANKIVYPRDMMATGENQSPEHRFNEGHGTACASIACSTDKSALGIAPKAQLMPIRFTGLGSVHQSEAIYWAVKNGADVISCSWGPPDGDIWRTDDDDYVFPLPDHTKLAFEYAAKKGRDGKGTPIVFAAGNGREPVKNDGYASSKYVLAVSAINYKDKPTKYSDYGHPTFCTFPSGDFDVDKDRNITNETGIYVADRLGEDGYSDNDYYSLFSGTSASCPGVAGILALMYGANPNLNLGEIKNLLQQSCEKIKPNAAHPAPNYSADFGYGLLRADKAVENTLKLKTNPKNMKMKNAISLHIGIDNVDQNYYSNLVPELFACVTDMEKMGKLANSLGYESNYLKNSEATRDNIKQKFLELGNSVEDGGIFLISYSGHGAQLEDKKNGIPNEDNEKDGNDESWVCYDGFLLDDEIYNALAEIKNEIRVLVVSDSCHSESITRFADFKATAKVYRERSLPPYLVREILKRNNQTAQQLRDKNAPSRANDFRVFVKNLSACKAYETAKEVDEGGMFTTALLQEYSAIAGEKASNYDTFIERVRAQVREYQNPNWSNSHKKSDLFDAQFPFAIEKITLTHNGVQETSFNPIAEETTPSIENEPLYVETDELIVEPKVVRSRGKIKDSSDSGSYPVSSRDIAGGNAWDKAYNYLLDHADEVSYVEPQFLYRNFTSAEVEAERGGGKETNEYLSTYPNPEKFPEIQNTFTWHLEDNYSGLRKANEHVFPEIKLGARSPKPGKDIVKIAHIDTGYIQGHPSQPAFLDKANGKGIGVKNNSAIDYDKLIAVQEQQGHGQATMSILAGNWVDLEHTDNRYIGFFGAVPYAKVLPIKISETVILFSGKRFAEAVEYAIEQGANVITMSMAGAPSRHMAKAINRAYEAGIVVVSAASNSFVKGALKDKIVPKHTLYPARYDRVIAAVGATCKKQPYLYDFYNPRVKAAGGLYMQTCYGPSSVWPTSMAAYTPNISWFNENKVGSYYSRSGGGTSSATPQIAAAAALYYQKYKSDLDQYQGKHAWKKAEIIRQALLQSADKSTEYNYVYGQGLLRAYHALEDEFSPAKIAPKIKKADAVSEKRKFLGRLIGLFKRRGIAEDSWSEETKESLREMMSMEIDQLLHKDPKLFDYLDTIDMTTEEVDITDNELINCILQSEHASDFLKNNLSVKVKNTGLPIRSTNPEFNHFTLESDHGDIRFKARGLEVAVSNQNSYKEFHNEQPFWVDEFELELNVSRSLRSGVGRSLQIEVGESDDEGLQSSILTELVYEDGTVIQKWDSPILEALEKNGKERSIEIAQSAGNVYTFSINEFTSNERGFGKKLKKAFVKVWKWVKGKANTDKLYDLLEPLGDHKYEIMVFDLEGSDIGAMGWKNIREFDEQAVFKSIADDSKPVGITFPGLFSKIEKGFDDFLEKQQYCDVMRQKHCRYLLGVNMATVVHGIDDNAEEIHKMFKGKLKGKACNVLARSRGGIVARYLFEKKWKGNANAPFVLNKMVMFGTPNQGTMIASSKNWKSMFNITTTVAKITLGTVAPIVPKLLSILKTLALGFANLPGIDDLEEESKVILELNKITMDRSNYYVFTSHYEPRNIFKKMFDDLLVDRAVFHGEYNDSVTPVPGAAFQNPEFECVVELKDEQIYLSSPKQGVSHFGYLNPKHPEIIERLFEIV